MTLPTSPVRLWLLATCALLLLCAPTSEIAAQDNVPERRIIVSLEDHRLWLVDRADTLLDVAVAVGRRESFRYGGQVYHWETPTGQRAVLDKRRDPIWTVPEWHYYERATDEGLRLVTMARGLQYPLSDGSRLEVRGRDVVRVLDGKYWKVPEGREIVIDGILFVPPMGTTQRQVPGVLGTRALNLGDGYLIHGTNPFNRGSIGSAASHGCIRMHNGDVERLYDLVEVGTPVLIR